MFFKRKLKKELSNNMGMGLVCGKDDDRDYKYSDLVMSSQLRNLPKNYESELPFFVYDQGQTSMCCACALNSIRYMQEKQKDQSELNEALSPCFTYGNREENQNYEGMELREACKKAREGQILFRELPHFTDVNTAMQLVKKKREAYRNKARPFRISSFYTCSNKDEIKSAIMETQAVLIGIPVYDCFYVPNKEGEIKYNAKKRGENHGGHAQVICGWKTDKNGKLWWKSLNSWGKQWGKDGYCWLPEDYPWADKAYVLIDDVTETKFKQYKERFKYKEDGK